MEAGGVNLPGIKELLLVKGQPAPGDGKTLLKPGEMLQARVVASSQDSVILNIGGARISAATDLALNSGQMISLMVVEMGPDRVVLKQIPAKAREAIPAKYTKDDLINYLLRSTNLTSGDLEHVAGLIKGVKIETGKEFAQLEKLLTQLIDHEGGAEGLHFKALAAEVDELIVRMSDGQQVDKQNVLARVKAMVDAIHHETNLIKLLESGEGGIKNIKAALLEARVVLQGRAEGLPVEPYSTIKASVEKLVDVLTAVEVLNLPVDSKTRELFYLPIPMQMGDHVTTAEIKIYSKGSSGRSGAKGSSVFTIGFALDMPSLGKTRAWVEVADKFINFSIAVENTKALAGRDNLFVELTQSLEEMGYTVGRTAFLDIKEEAKEEASRSLIEEKLGVRQEGIDIKV